MPICNLSDLPRLLQPGQCLLGIDYGQTAIGVAIADPAHRVASPLATIARGKFAAVAAAIGKIVADRNIGGMVIGLPKNMDGSESGAAQAARSFAANLMRGGALATADMPITFWDERLSTAAVERFMIEDDMTRARRDAVVDKAAAAYILQGALDRIQQMSG